MCDCPTAGVFTTHESHRSWIIYKECKTSNGTGNTTVQAGIQSTMTRDNDGANTNSDLLFTQLDPHLRPISPDLTCQQSVQLYEEHKMIAQEYWGVQEELVYVLQRKKQLEDKQKQQKERKKRIEDVQNERDSLLAAMECMREHDVTAGSSRNSGDNWVFVENDDQRMN